MTGEKKLERLEAKDRVKLATRTEAPVTEEMLKRFQDPRTIRILHAAMGLCTESGELLDAMKRHLFYGKTLDEQNILEEMGDLDWYNNLLCSVFHTTMALVELVNIKKLATRYGDKFSEDMALIRDLVKEREVLEEHLEHGNIQSGEIKRGPVPLPKPPDAFL